jgi:hypothetical protein
LPPQDVTEYTEKLELEAWRQAAILVVSLAAFVFFVQRLFGPIFQLAFEVFIFHVPAITITLLYFYFKTRLPGSEPRS